jgi:hypothetical protein
VIAQQLAQQVSAEALGANGVACGAGAFLVIRDGLSGPARRYVLQHELEQLLVLERSEAETNYAAARVVPLGMAATVVESVWLVAWGEGTAGCKLAGLWAGFRTYFLGASS